jgi:hypothetical protein
MSNPNSALGEWLLRQVLNLKANELLTYRKLEDIGLDSVVIYKIADGKYDIDFTKIGAYEDYVSANDATGDEAELSGFHCIHHLPCDCFDHRHAYGISELFVKSGIGNSR